MEIGARKYATVVIENKARSKSKTKSTTPRVRTTSTVASS